MPLCEQRELACGEAGRPEIEWALLAAGVAHGGDLVQHARRGVERLPVLEMTHGERGVERRHCEPTTHTHRTHDPSEHVDFVATDWGTTGQRRASKSPPGQGGWGMFHSWHAGADCVNPAVYIAIRATGDTAWFGWPKVPSVETEVDAWFEAKNLDEEKAAIKRLNKAALENVVLFHAGTAPDPTGSIVTAGGRVLTVVGSGDTYEAAIARAYAGVRAIDFDGMQYRTDIGQKALANVRNAP